MEIIDFENTQNRIQKRRSRLNEEIVGRLLALGLLGLLIAFSYL